MFTKTPAHRSAFCLGLLTVTGLSLTGCAETNVPAIDRASADIGDLNNDGVSVVYFKTPQGYKRGDKLIAYEGPGWESDKTAFRLYLDGRNALDIFGKKTPDMVLESVGRGDDYHAMAGWGMDILKVGNSLGAGGFGVFENGEVRQIGRAQSYSASILKDTENEAVVKVVHSMSETCQDDVTTTYSILGGSRISKINIEGDCALPYAAGLIIHPETSSYQSSGNEGWQYKARYGEQSLVPDNLGLALFYKADQVSSIGTDSDDDYIVFKSGLSPQYYTAAVWEQEQGGVTDAQAFQVWLKSTQKELNQK